MHNGCYSAPSKFVYCMHFCKIIYVIIGLPYIIAVAGELMSALRTIIAVHLMGVHTSLCNGLLILHA